MILDDKQEIIDQVMNGEFLVQYKTHREWYNLRSWTTADILTQIANSDQTPVFTLGKQGIAEFEQWCKLYETQC